MGVSLGHSRDLMTIAQVSYHVTVSVQPRDKLCCFCHFTGCVGTVILPGGFGLSFYRVASASHYYTTADVYGDVATGCTALVFNEIYV